MVPLQSLSTGFWLGFLFWFSPKLGIFLQAMFPALQTNSLLTAGPEARPSMCFQAAAAAGCPSAFLTFTVSLIKRIARGTKSLLISLSLKTSRCFSRCHILKIPSGMQEADSGPVAEARAQRHTEREAQLTCSASPAQHIREKWVKKKKTTPHYGVSNKLRNFFDFHDVHMAVNFRVML